MATVNVPVDSELSRLIREAGQSGEPLLVDTGDGVYELEAHASRDTPEIPAPTTESQDPVLSILGIGETLEPTDIAQHKQAYLADAFDNPSRR